MARKDLNLSRKSMTGAELGRLTLRDQLNISGEPSPFSEKEWTQLERASLVTNEDIADYNRHVGVWRSYLRLSNAAVVGCMETSYNLSFVSGLLYQQTLLEHMRRVAGELPLVVTAKELKDRRAAQKKRLQARLYPAGYVIEKRAEELWREESGGASPDDVPDARWDELFWEMGFPALKELVEAKKLTPIDLKHRADRMTPQQVEHFFGIPEPEEGWAAMLEDLEANYPERWGVLFGEGFREPLKARILEAAELGDLTEGHDLEEWRHVEHYSQIAKTAKERRTLEDYLGRRYFSGAELLATGWPEWSRWLDTFHVLEEPEGKELHSIAVLVEKDETIEQWSGIDVDKKSGHYKDEPRKSLLRYGEMFTRRDPRELQTALYRRIDNARSEIRSLLAMRQVLQELSLYFGHELDFTAFLEKTSAWPSLVYEVAVYQEVRSLPHSGEPFPSMKPLQLDKLTPDAKMLKESRQAFSETLGAGWWKSVSGEAEADA